MQNAGLEVTTKVYPSTVIPDRNEFQMMSNVQKKNYRPNNFMNEAPIFARNGTYFNGMGNRGYIDEEDN